MKLLMAVRTN